MKIIGDKKNMKIYDISWQEYYFLIQKMIKEIEEKYLDYKILSISRGGLIPATIISHQTKQSIDVINVFSYNKNKRNKVYIKPFSAYDEEIPNKILIVDDLIDSGNTLFRVWEFIYNKIHKNNLLDKIDIKSAVLIDKKQSALKPDFSAKQMDDLVWINFPYEKR